MYRQPTNITSPKQLLTDLSQTKCIVHYIEYNETISVVAKCHRKKNQMMEGYSRKLGWIYRSWKVGDVGIEQCWIDFVGDGDIVDFVSVGAGRYVFWISHLKYNKKHNKSQPDTISITQFTNKQLHKIHEIIIPACKINNTEIEQSKWLIVEKKILFLSHINSVVIQRSYQAKCVINEGVQINLKWVLTVSYIQLGKKQTQIEGGEVDSICYTYYYAFREMQRNFHILHPTNLPKKPTQTNPLSITRNNPIILTYETLPILPNHLSQIQQNNCINIKIFKMQLTQYQKWPNSNSISRNIVVQGYILEKNDDDENQDQGHNDDVSQLVNYIVEETGHTMLHKNVQKQTNNTQATLLICTTKKNQSKILRACLDLYSYTCKVVAISQHPIPVHPSRILHMEYTRGFVWILLNQLFGNQNIITYLPIDAQSQQINQKWNKIILGDGVETLLNIQPVMICDEFSRIRLFFTTVSTDESNKPNMYINMMEMANKKLLYIKLLQQLFLSPNNSDHQSMGQMQLDHHLVQIIAKDTLSLL